MPTDFEIRQIKPIEIGGIDIGGHNSTAGPDLLRKPHSHRSAACPDFEATPSWLNNRTPLTRTRIEDFFKEAESFIFSLLAPRCSKAVRWFGCMDTLAVRSISMLRHVRYRNPSPTALSILPEMT